MPLADSASPSHAERRTPSRRGCSPLHCSLREGRWKKITLLNILNARICGALLLSQVTFQYIVHCLFPKAAPEKLMVAQLFKKFPALYITPMFITVLTTACYFSLSSHINPVKDILSYCFNIQFDTVLS